MAQVVRRPNSASPSTSRSFSQSPQKKHHTDSPSSSFKKGNHQDRSSSSTTCLPSSPTKQERKKLAKHILASGGDQLKATLKQSSMLHALLSDPVKFIKSNQKQGQDYTTLGLTPVNDPNFSAIQNRKQEQKQHSLLLHTHSSIINPNDTPPSDSEQDQTPSTNNGKSHQRDLYPYKLSLRFPGKVTPVATGLNNYGNTCYMNSVMQSLIHTPPLAFALVTQDLKSLHGDWGGKRNPEAFDAVTALQAFARRSLAGSKSSNAPLEFIRNLKSFAKPLRKGAQEDAHEYLRFLLEALQQSCLARAPKSLKPDHPVRHTTFVHKTFGGKLRSRVTCHACGHNSDTFDPFMDLSLDMRKGINCLTDAFRAFVAKDSLSGSEKYKCDKCKRKVDATKQFTIHTAPPALTVHLKRFTIFGTKISRQIAFDETLNIAPYMSVNKAPERYRLYAVVHHYGSGPSSGHYVASVRSPNGRWTKMDDSYASEMGRSGPINDQSAYILFYLSEKDQVLEKAILKAVAPSPKHDSKRKQPSLQVESSQDSAPEEESEMAADAFDDQAAYQALLLKRRKGEAAAQTESNNKAKTNESQSESGDSDTLPACGKTKLNCTGAKLDQMLSCKPKPPSSFYGAISARVSSNPFSMPSSSTAAQDDDEELGTTVSRDEYESLVGAPSTWITSACADPEADSGAENEENDEMRIAAVAAALSKKEKRRIKKAAQAIDNAKKERSRGVPASPYASALTSSMASNGSGKNKKVKKDKAIALALGGFVGRMKPRPSF
ncbi:related to ubiquitin carboxyl-terminal hydrolase 36 [Melanopsichium pennsylvanicum]|uniref:Ubiquitin carboxyl-terminal hydrolase n=2 Tax=Melanopsichium pennsylvanicum TaxID=63383 RepID=A0AAJ4XHH7_9BASI|nr:related to ubiquitin carboxyl-terminal hydrolase 36 [Melanopsichium pennsylvanicum 4]SNX82659.1 related to ubiquitin carboxyl-terminal hydrolase 36 [Melanopsichium pennsylvanicum]